MQNRMIFRRALISRCQNGTIADLSRSTEVQWIGSGVSLYIEPQGFRCLLWGQSLFCEVAIDRFTADYGL